MAVPERDNWAAFTFVLNKLDDAAKTRPVPLRLLAVGNDQGLEEFEP